MRIVGRFAPSPSGRLHIGNIFSSLLCWLDAADGELIFRLEDLDPERSWDEYAQLMVEDLRWLGLNWDRGWPMDDAYRQGKRGERYAAAVKKLTEMGLTYECFCSRAERLAAGAPHFGEGDGFGCRCRFLKDSEKREKLRNGKHPALKVVVPDEEITIFDRHYGAYKVDLRKESGDFIIRRSDGVFAYQLAVSVDDAEMGVTRVVRARDLLPSAAKQRYLIETLYGVKALGDKGLRVTVPEYCHVPLLVSPEGRKLSKREGDLNMGTLRERYSAEELIGILGYLAGIIDRPEPLSANELRCEFGWEKVRHEDIVLPDWI